jgi:DNA-binding NtrC family response regulator
MLARDDVGARGRILFVDDERRVLTSMRATFRRDYDVQLANSGAEALDLLRDHDVDVIVSDQRMPGMTGVEVLKAVKTLAPRAMRILLTGYADLKAIESSINEGEVFRYLTKPCPTEQLREAIALAVEASRLPMESVEEAELAEPVRAAPPAMAPPQPVPMPAAADTGDDFELFEVIPAGAKTPERVRKPIVPPPPRAEKPAAAPPLAASAPEPKVRKSESAQVVPIRVRPDSRPRRAKQEIRDVDLLALTTDAALVTVLEAAVSGGHRLHRARSLEEALTVLGEHPVGVLVTDMAVRQDGIAHLTTELKRRIPDLITIVASDRSDAQLLIDLINYGQIFRFLLKPLHPGQCRLSIESAVARHRDLAADPALARRHTVTEKPAPAGTGLVGQVIDRVRRLRERFFATGGAA